MAVQQRDQKQRREWKPANTHPQKPNLAKRAPRPRVQIGKAFQLQERGRRAFQKVQPKWPETMRLQRFIAICTELSRRAAETAITDGRVELNGVTVRQLGTNVHLQKDHVRLDGKHLLPPQEHLYIAFHKPLHLMVTKSDPEGRETIWDKWLARWKQRLNAAGRLDFDSDGLLLLSDDGNFINAMTHPRHELWKTYRVKVSGHPTPEALARLATGVVLAGRDTLPAQVKLVKTHPQNALVEIRIREGRNRQIRKMCEEVGFPVIRLTRVAVGPVSLAGLKPGKWRFLKPHELKALKAEVLPKPTTLPVIRKQPGQRYRK